MGTPGSGRYTSYIPVKSSKLTRLFKLFKFGAPEIYEGQDENRLAAQVSSERAKELLNGEGDPDMFGSGVSLEFADAPATAEAEFKWKNSGDPANPYVPDITSPGPGLTEGVDKTTDPKIKTTDIKPNFDPANPTVNTTSPSSTSKRLGTFSMGENLELGKSSKR